MTNLDRSRLDRADMAALQAGEPATVEEARMALGHLCTAIVALQSLDDLGSPEANREAWDRMLQLERRERRIRDRFGLQDFNWHHRGA